MNKILLITIIVGILLVGTLIIVGTDTFYQFKMMCGGGCFKI